MSSAPCEFECAQQLDGLSSFLEEGHFSDISIRLPDGSTVQAHRVLIAAVSKVLKAKFTMSEHAWSPEVGSALAWQWLIDWVYGRMDLLPCDLIVEMLVLADHFQMPLSKT
ncbi:unnamed protein product [Polarella glacialis]|uniref:BTB domain-containing protein n=1 Tax=Polarella glacialis TaxID=89957 RepID=A0A813D0T7_POLGL|nr:unnamed protein product [Polarella glacialis]